MLAPSGSKKMFRPKARCMQVPHGEGLSRPQAVCRPGSAARIRYRPRQLTRSRHSKHRRPTTDHAQAPSAFFRRAFRTQSAESVTKFTKNSIFGCTSEVCIETTHHETQPAASSQNGCGTKTHFGTSRRTKVPPVQDKPARYLQYIKKRGQEWETFS